MATETPIGSIDVHDAANLFPRMDAAQYEDLKADIEAHGQREPCETYQGKLIDGRNRLRVCEDLGIEPKTIALDVADDFDPVAYVLSKNLHRRHLTESQRAMVAAEVSAHYEPAAETRMKSGKAADPTAQMQQGSAAALAAESARVSTRLVYNAKAVLREGCPEVIEAVRDGLISAGQAAKLVEAVPKKSQAKKIEPLFTLPARLRSRRLTDEIDTAKRRRKKKRPSQPPQPAQEQPQREQDDLGLRQLVELTARFHRQFADLSDPLLSSDPHCVRWAEDDLALLNDVREKVALLTTELARVIAAAEKARK